MKEKLLRAFTAFAVILSISSIEAQTYQHLQVASGYSADVIANGAGTAMSSTTAAVDAANYNFMANNFQPTAAPAPAYALPATGLVTSLVNSALTYQLGPLSGNNSLQVSTQNASATLTFTNAVQASRLYVIATTGSGSATMSATIQFSDASSQPLTGVLVPDWFDSTAQPIAAWGFGRVLRTNNTIENPTNNPRLYQLSLNVLPENQLKTVTGIQFTKTSSAEGIINVFAVTAELTGACPSPGGLTAVAAAASATLTWTPSIISPAAGYDYYYSTSNTPPTGATVPTGNVASGTTSVELPGLATGTAHYAWVRSNCSATEKGPWVMVTFTPGQISGTYTTGDIPTLYGTPTTTTANSCPGTLTINVPVGYQIASVATAYTMTTASNGWTAEQRSLLACTTTNTTEAAVTAGTGNSGGTQTYSRTGLNLANGATGTVQFELRAWRTYGGSGCNTTWNRVDNNSWTVTVTYSPLTCITPANPVAAAQSVCNGSTLSALTATGAAGATFNWYAAATGGSALAGTTVLTSTTYYVSQVVSGCESDRTPVVVTLTTVTAPTATAQAFCAGATVANLVATGETGATFSWYAAATGGTALASTATLTATTYYVAQTVSGCQSTRTPVTVTINTVAPPTASAQSFCTSGTVAGLTATGATEATFHWYAAATGGTELSSDTALTATTYYVSQTVGTCESARTPVAVTFTAPAAPTASAQSFCTSGTVAGLTATGATGATFHWYADATGGTELTANTALTATTYYVSQTVGSCESARTPVAVTITTLTPPTAADQGFCVSGTVAELMANGEAMAELHWYDAATGGTPLAGSTPLVSGTYYVSQSLNGCESDRESVEVAIYVTPVPNVENGATGCYGITVNDAGGAFDIFHIYESQAGGTPLAGDYVLATGTYYISQTLNGCESERAPVEVTVIELEEPMVALDQEFCSGATLADVMVEYSTGAAISWHAVEGGEALPATTVITDGSSYYAVQHLYECESAAAQYVAMVHATPDSPQGDEEQDFTEGEAVAALEVATAAGATVTWYVLDGTTYEAISDETLLEDGATYYCSQWIDGCESAFLAVTANEVLSTKGFGLKNLLVYPNPANDVINITNDDAISRITITNLLGQKVLEDTVDGNAVQVNIQHLQQGNYILQVYTNNGMASLKIAKR